MKTLVKSFFAVSFWLFALTGVTFASTLSLDPAAGTFNRGCIFSLNVIVDTQGIQTDGTDAIILYDSTRFNALSITNGSIYPDFPGNNIDSASGKITIAGIASVSTSFSGKGTLATINFTVLENAPAGSSQVKFDFDPNDKGKTTDSNVVERDTIAETLNSVVNGNFIVGTGSCGVQATSTPAPGGNTLPRTGATGSTGYGAFQSTPSATYAPEKTLPQGGTQELTSMLVIIGGVLTVLGVLGLALL